ncbi:MAG TPA: hypothetical protein VEJ21_00865, partial [Acidimicrobiales bacterium]|nr:hypothetical protein [Acidimicrobiales bacterium]
AGVATDLDPDTVVVAGQASRVAAEAEAAAEAVAEEGAEAAAPEGEAAAETTTQPAGGGEEG